MRKLLIADDGSPSAQAALEDLPQAGLPPELEVSVISVADVWLPDQHFGGSTPDQGPVPVSGQKARAQALAAVATARQQAERTTNHLRPLFPKWKLTADACADSPAWGIIRKSNEWKADLVVVGSHGRGALERLFLGSVAQKVAVEAPCSVRIARPRRTKPEARLRLVLALDGSVGSQRLLRAVSSRTWTNAVEFRLLTIIDARLQTAAAWPGILADQWVQHQDQESLEWISRMAETSANHLRNAGLTVESHIFHGDPKDVLVAQAEDWEADCIFVGDRGLNHGDRLTLGTVAAAVAARARCSVEIVRAP